MDDPLRVSNLQNSINQQNNSLGTQSNFNTSQQSRFHQTPQFQAHLYAHAILHNKAAQFEQDSLRLSKDSLYSSFFSNKRLTQPGRLGGGQGSNLNRVESTDSIHNVFGASNFQFGANKAQGGGAGAPNNNSDLTSNKSQKQPALSSRLLNVPRFGSGANNSPAIQSSVHPDDRPMN